MDAWLPSRRQTAFRGLELTTPQTHSACKLDTQSGCRETQIFSWVDLKNSPKLTTHDMLCKKMEAWQTCGTWMMVTSCVTRSWCRLACTNSTTPVQKLEQNELGAAPPEWNIDGVQSMATVSTVTAGSTTLRVAVGPDSSLRTSSWPTFEQCTNVSNCVRTRRQNVVSHVNVLVSVVSTTFCECTATQCCRRNELPKSTTKVGQRSHERHFPGFTVVQATLSASQSGIGNKRARDIAALPHLGALTAARPIQDAVTAGLLLKRPLEARLGVVIETATSTNLGALDDEDRATAKLYVQKAAQAADESWQQTVDEHNGPCVTDPTMSDLEHPSSAPLQTKTVMIWTSQHPRRSRLSARELQAQLSRWTDRTRLARLKITLLSKGAWQQVTRIEDLCHTRVSHMALPLGRVCGKCPDTARLHHHCVVPSHDSPQSHLATEAFGAWKKLLESSVHVSPVCSRLMSKRTRPCCPRCHPAFNIPARQVHERLNS